MSLFYNGKNISFAKELRKNATQQEKYLWYAYLSKYPVRFQRQKAIDDYIADFYCHKAKLVVELDGSQHFFPSNAKNDELRSRILNKYDLLVIRFTNYDLDKHFAEVCMEIDRTVKKRLDAFGAGFRED